MKDLFDDFEVTTCTNGFFELSIDENENIKYNIYDHETESNRIYLTHKVTGATFEFESKGDDSELKSLNELWISNNKDTNSFASAVANFVF